MRRRLELEQVLRAAWSELGGVPHPEDRFLCRWLERVARLAPQRAASPAAARAFALAALDQVDGLDGAWSTLSLSALLHALPENDRGSRIDLATSFVGFLTDEGWLSGPARRRLCGELAALRVAFDRNASRSLAA